MSPLEIPLEVRKEMEIAWRQVRAVGRMGENLKLQRIITYYCYLCYIVPLFSFPFWCWLYTRHLCC